MLTIGKTEVFKSTKEEVSLVINLLRENGIRFYLDRDHLYKRSGYQSSNTAFFFSKGKVLSRVYVRNKDYDQARKALKNTKDSL